MTPAQKRITQALAGAALLPSNPRAAEALVLALEKMEPLDQKDRGAVLYALRLYLTSSR